MTNRVEVYILFDEPFYYSIETYAGSSDHELFNNWGVGVPGIMMAAWPDKWYHTSGDLADKADATQMKRAVVIGAAGAFTIANADADMAIKIAGEIASNATRRLGHQLVVSLETLNNAQSDLFSESYKSARWRLEAAILSEQDTLDTIVELAPGDENLTSYIRQIKKSVTSVGAAQLAILDSHMGSVAGKLGVKSAMISLDVIEKKAASITPQPSPRVRENGPWGHEEYINAVPSDERAKFPFTGNGLMLANVDELQRLINGTHSALDIKKMLDAQYTRKSSVQAILNYLEILKIAGLVEW